MDTLASSSHRNQALLRMATVISLAFLLLLPAHSVCIPIKRILVLLGPDFETIQSNALNVTKFNEALSVRKAVHFIRLNMRMSFSSDRFSNARFLPDCTFWKDKREAYTGIHWIPVASGREIWKRIREEEWLKLSAPSTFRWLLCWRWLVCPTSHSNRSWKVFCLAFDTRSFYPEENAW